MDSAQLPHATYVPGRQEIIDNSASPAKRDFIISVGVLFGTAIIGSLVRLVIRISGRREIRWDDVLVAIATVALVAAFCVCLKLIKALYLLEALDEGLITLFQEEIPVIYSTSKWAAIFAATNHSAIYLVKLAFLRFFHILTQAQSRHITRFYWIAVGSVIVCWIITALCPIIICPYFGTEAAICSSRSGQHARSLGLDCFVACVDIVTDLFIVTLPILILRKTMMPLIRKISLASLCCLSIVMIICAIIRLAGTIANTLPNGNGSAPVWDTYWAIVEACVALIMTSVIVIRSAFIAQQVRDDKLRQESILRRFGRRLLSTLRLPGSPGSSRRSPPRAADDQLTDQDVSNGPHIGTQNLTRGTLTGVKTFISTGKRHGGDQAGLLKSVDTTFVLEDLDYHQIRKNEMSRPSTGAGSTQPGTLHGHNAGP